MAFAQDGTTTTTTRSEVIILLLTMNQPTLQFPGLFIDNSNTNNDGTGGSTDNQSRNEDGHVTATGTTTDYQPSASKDNEPLSDQQQKEYVDQSIIPHRLQLGLGINNGAHGSLYKCHTLYLEYKSLLPQLQEPPPTDGDANDQELKQQGLRLLIQRTHRQLIAELKLQQVEFHKLIFLQESRQRDEIVQRQQRRKTTTHEEGNNLPTLLPELRERSHLAKQLHSCYQEYDSIIQVVYNNGNNKMSPPTLTTTQSQPPPQQQLSLREMDKSKRSNNAALQATYEALLHDKRTLQDQLSNRQQQELQLRKQQLHLLQQTIQDMKSVPIKE